NASTATTTANHLAHAGCLVLVASANSPNVTNRAASARSTANVQVGAEDGVGVPSARTSGGTFVATSATMTRIPAPMIRRACDPSGALRASATPNIANGTSAIAPMTCAATTTEP